MFQSGSEDEELRSAVLEVFRDSFPEEALHSLGEMSDPGQRLSGLESVAALGLEEFFSDDGASFAMLGSVAQAQASVLCPVDVASYLFLTSLLPTRSSQYEEFAKVKALLIGPYSQTLYQHSETHAEVLCALLATLSAPIASDLTKKPSVMALFFTDDGTCQQVEASSVAQDPAIDFSLLTFRAEVEKSATRTAFESIPSPLANPIAVLQMLISFQLCGLVARALDMSVQYVSERKQFDVPVGGFQAVQHALSDVSLRSESMLALAELAAAYADASDSQFIAAADAAHRYAILHSAPALEKCIQAHGGTGYTWEYPLHHYLRRVLYLSRAFEREGRSIIFSQL